MLSRDMHKCFARFSWQHFHAQIFEILGIFLFQEKEFQELDKLKTHL